MADRERQLLERLLPIFREEAQEHIVAISAGVARLGEAAPDELPSVVETVFRVTHSLKAAARAVARNEIERVCQSVESVFAALQRQDIAVSQDLLDCLYGAADGLEDFLAAIDAAPDPVRQSRAASLAGSLDAALQAGMRAARPAAAAVPAGLPARIGSAPASRPPAMPSDPPPVVAPRPDKPPAEPPKSDVPAVPAVASSDTVRLSIQRLDILLRQAEEMVAEKLASRRLVTELRDMGAELSAWRAEATALQASLPAARLKPQRRGLPARPAGAADRSGEFVLRTESRIRHFQTRLSALEKLAAADFRGLASKVDRLLYDMKRTLTLPCSSLFQLFPRVVRDLARDQGKEVALAMTGGELEMDRRILEELKDPLLHLIRNCIDHGIERPEARRAAGKPERAAVTVEVAVVDGDKVAVSIADDGAGIARDRVAATAARLGLLGADAAERPDSELLPLIFQSGLSTSPMITDLSGRGLGLAIVRERVERLGGTVTVDSQPGQGCIFRLVVPLTLATYRGILVRAAGRLFVIPTLGVERVVGVRSDEVGTIESRPVVEIGGTAVPLVRLSDVLELPPAPRPPEAGGRIVALVLGAMARRTAFAVDAIEGDQEVLMKPLGRYLVRVRNVQGATVLPTGQIAPILNIHDLLKSAAKAVRAGPAATAAERTVASARKSILLAEDSITARTLLKAILEGAGYHVKTSVDGMEAWANLKLEPFDLLVSDVEMPRMNGFELTERIRADPNLAELPIVLVTALDTREHRERGAEAGADAYITKGGFDQARLLETVRRLV